MAAVDSLSDLDADDLTAEADAAVAQIRSALRQLERVAEVLVDRDALAGITVDLRDIKSEVAAVFDEFKTALLSEAGEKSFDVPNLGRFEVKRSIKRSGWQWDDLLPLLARKAREERHFDGDAGSVEGEAEAAMRVFRSCVSFSSAKVRGLEERGIQVDEFCSVDSESYDVQLPRSA